MFPLGYSDALPCQWSKQSFAFFYYSCYLEETKPICLFSQSCHRSTLSDQQSDYCSCPPPHPSLLLPRCTPDPQPENCGHKTPGWILNIQELQCSVLTEVSSTLPDTRPHTTNCHSSSTATQLPPLWKAPCKHRGCLTPLRSHLRSHTFLLTKMITHIT